MRSLVLAIAIVLSLLLGLGCVSSSEKCYQQNISLQQENMSLQNEVNRLSKQLAQYEENFPAEVVIPCYRRTDGSPIVIRNNINAVNPTWEELVMFLRNDSMEKDCYLDTGYQDSRYVCGDFAMKLHDNAEIAGIRSAVAVIRIEKERRPHALNAFMTTDKGLVYIDCTGTRECYATDKVAFIEVGKQSGAVDLQLDIEFSHDWFLQQRALFLEYAEVVKKCTSKEFEVQASVYDSIYQGREYVYIANDYGIVTGIEVFW